VLSLRCLHIWDSNGIVRIFKQLDMAVDLLFGLGLVRWKWFGELSFTSCTVFSELFNHRPVVGYGDGKRSAML
jgi:hypothetical protein